MIPALVLLATTGGAVVECADEAGAAPDRALRVAVYDVQAAGIEPHVAAVVTDAVVAEVRKLDKLAVVSLQEVKAMLAVEADKQLVGCDQDSCLAEIAAALGADLVVTGSVAKVGDEHVFGLRVFDERTAKATAQSTKRLTDQGGEELLAAVGPMVQELFPDRPLRGGQIRGVKDELALRLHPPPLPAWTFWTGVGTAGALAVTGGALTTLWVLRQRDFDAFRAQPLFGGAEFKARATELQVVEGGMWLAWGATAATALAVTAAAFFTDFYGYADEHP